jgi:hypothetical protein
MKGKGFSLRGKMLVLGLILGGLGGCAGPSALERDYGRSVKHNLVQQLVNPQAGLDLTPAVGLDPKAGEYALDRYDKSFKEREAQPPTIQLLTR